MLRHQVHATNARTSRGRTLLAGVALLLAGVAEPTRAQRAPRVGADAARATNYVRQHIDAGDGLQDGQVAALAQTPDGYIWIGTRRGLARFDGLAFTAFTPDAYPALQSGAINALTVDPKGPLWISTAQGLIRLEKERFERVPDAEIPRVSTWELVRTREGRLFVVGAFGVRVHDGKRFVPVPGIDAYLYSVLQDRRGRIWVAGRQFLASFDESGANLRVASFTGDHRYFDLSLDGSGRVWVGERRGLSQVDDSTGTIRERQRIPTNEGTRLAEVWTMSADVDGTLWLGTSTRGVLRWDGTRLRQPELPASGARDPIWSLLLDSRGRMWAGTADGLTRYTRSPFDVVVSGMANRSTWSLRRDRDGILWAATDDGELWQLDGERWRVRTPPTRVERPALNTWPLRAGGLLVSDDEGHAYVLTARDTRAASIGSMGPRRTIVAHYEDTDGSLWSVTDSGIYRYRDGRTTEMSRTLGLSRGDRPSVLWRDDGGRLLVGRPYLTILQGKARRRLGPREGLTDPEVTALFEQGATLWIGTADSGLFVMRGDTITPLGPRNPRLRLGINGIGEDGNGYLWMTTSSGLLRASRQELESAIGAPGRPVSVRLFDRADGLPTLEFFGDNQSRLTMDASGAIWLPSYAGPVRLNPSGIAGDATPPRVQLESAEVDGRLYPVGDTIRLPEHPRHVDVTFAATSASVPQRVRAAYRILGVDSTWTEVGRRRAITFGPLAGGRYTVEIRVAEEGGLWSPEVGRLVVDVALDWSERRWFYPVLVLLAGALVMGFIRWRVAASERRALQLEAVVAERTAALAQSRDQLEVRVAERTAALAQQLEERTRLEQRLSIARKLESLGRLAGGVSHEINNALTSVLGFAQLAELSAGDNQAVRADLQEVARAGRRAADITQQLLAFAKRQHTELAPVVIDRVLTDLTRSLEQLLAPGMSLTVEVAPDLPPIAADRSQLEQLVVNLVKNARDASPPDGNIRISVALTTLADGTTIRDQLLPAGDYIGIMVRDHGSGIAPDILDQLFDPFFTTKDLNVGTGLGLAVCQGIAARHYGAIEVESAVGGPTTFRVLIPVRHAPDTGLPSATGSAHGTETILLVDDEAGIRKVAARILSLHGYRVIDAADGEFALNAYRGSADTIDAVVTDVIMPRMTGLELARRLRRVRPSLPILFVSGFTGHNEADLEQIRSLGPLIPKPFTPETLTHALRTVLDAAVSR
jgi:signal transduction histidine kinase/ligand-binding sensor domain-containing protein